MILSLSCYKFLLSSHTYHSSCYGVFIPTIHKTKLKIEYMNFNFMYGECFLTCIKHQCASGNNTLKLLFVQCTGHVNKDVLCFLNHFNIFKNNFLLIYNNGCQVCNEY